MMRGLTPAMAPPWAFAIGVRPYFSAASLVARVSVAAPSFTPEEFPAVTVLSELTKDLSLAKISGDVSGRGCSSSVTIIGSPFRWGI